MNLKSFTYTQLFYLYSRLLIPLYILYGMRKRQMNKYEGVGENFYETKMLMTFETKDIKRYKVCI